MFVSSREDHRDILVLHRKCTYMSLLNSRSKHVVSQVTSVVFEEVFDVTVFSIFHHHVSCTFLKSLKVIDAIVSHAI